MHGVLRRYTLDAKHVDEVIRRIAEGGVPIVKAISGFVSYAILDAGHGHVVTYSVYESKTGTEESTKKAATWVNSWWNVWSWKSRRLRERLASWT